MLILSIDCAGSGCGVCVWQDGVVLSESDERMERGQDQRLMPLIIEAMQRANVTFDNLDRIAITRGPGSFTGLRIGLAAARGIGLAANKPVIGIDRFSIYREAFKNSGKDHAVVINSRRKELYCCFYPGSGAAHAPTMLTFEEITEFLKASPTRHSREGGNPSASDSERISHVPLRRAAMDSRLRGNDGSGNTITITGDIAPHLFTNFQLPTEPEYITSAKLAASVNPNDPEFLPRPLYIRAPDVTFPADKKPHYELRPLSVAHAEQLAALHAESFGKAAWSLQQIQSSLRLDTTRGWGIFVHDKIVGFILCQLIPDQSEVLALCVHPSHRRQGSGEKLMRAAADAADQAGSHLYLEVAADNSAALKLYEKLGFQRTGHRPRYYQIGKRAVDAILLTLTAPKH